MKKIYIEDKDVVKQVEDLKELATKIGKVSLEKDNLSIEHNEGQLNVRPSLVEAVTADKDCPKCYNIGRVDTEDGKVFVEVHDLLEDQEAQFKKTQEEWEEKEKAQREHIAKMKEQAKEVAKKIEEQAK